MAEQEIPPEWQQIVVDAIADSLERRGQAMKATDQLVAEVRAAITQKMRDSGRDPEQVPPYMDSYLGHNLSRIIHFALVYADNNPPTHRKGYGEAFRTVISNPDALIFLFEGGMIGDVTDGPNPGFPPPEEFDPDHGDGGVIIGPQPLPDHIFNVALHMEAAFGHLNFGSDDSRRKWTRMTAEQAVYEYPGEGWGHKSASPSHPPSKDAIARRTGSLIEAWDLVSGATRRVTRGGYYNISNQHFIEVPGVNHLGV